MLEQPGAWDTDNPAIKAGIEPRVATAIRIQQRLARQLDAHRRSNKLAKSDLAASLHISTAQLRRLADGYAPITMLQACAVANLLGIEPLPEG
jgi:DNA-binding Xre family transcriptional regulator